MPINILMPALSPTMTLGNLSRWLKKEGDVIKAGEVIAEIETDKATMEVEAVDEGILAKILIAEGSENVPVNEIIAIITEEGESLANLQPTVTKENFEPIIEVLNNNTPSKDIVAKTNITNSGNHDVNPRIFISPLAKRIAEQNNLDYKSLQGSGPRGRIIKTDIENFLAKELVQIADKSKVINTIVEQSGHSLIPHTNMRKIIAKRLTESKQTIPHFYLTVECEIDKLLSMRSELNEQLDQNIKLSVNDFMIKATALALAKNPNANASWEEAGIRKYTSIDVCVAVATDNGLVTPIIKQANLKSLSELSKTMKDLAVRARANKLAPEEYQGGSITISNLGMFGIKQFNAIINPPQSCIISIGASSEQVIAKKGNIVIANIVSLTLSCDHRVVDGAVAAKLLSELKQFLENPLTMLV